MKKIYFLTTSILFLLSINLGLAQDPCPEAKMSDPSLEKEMLNAFQDDKIKDNTGKEVSKVVITVRDWKVLRSELTNTPYKLITAAVLYKKKDKCFSELLDFESQFDGVEYSKSVKVTGWRSAKKVSCDCLGANATSTETK